jgi:hypothetical protein
VLDEFGHTVLPLVIEQFDDLELFHARCVKDVQKFVKRSSQEGWFKVLSFTDFDVELFNGLVEVLNVVNEECLVHTNGGNEFLILTEDGVGDSRLMPGSAFRGAKCVHVNKHALGLFRGNRQVFFGVGVCKRVYFVGRLIDRLGLLALKVKLLHDSTFRTYT